MLKKVALTVALGASVLGSAGAAAQSHPPLLNASYDIARELFAAINPKFVEYWEEKTGETAVVDQSFAGSSRQAQDILQGKRADTVTFNQVTDVNILAERGFVAEDWAERLPNNASPYYSTIAFLVRKDNPKNIQTWDDLVRDDVSVVFPNPKTSGNARYTYLSAWLHANEKFDGDEEQIREFVGSLLHNVANFPTGGRGATVAFAQNRQGDALLTFESEVINIANSEEFNSGDYEIVVPPVSVLAEFPVAVVDRVVDQKGTRDLATAYLEYQYSKEIQELLTTFNYRIHHPEVVEATADQFADVRLINPNEVLGDWAEINQTHFSSGGVLDQLLANRP